MTNLELIDRLCDLTTKLIDIVLEQREFIMLHEDEEPPGLREKTEQALAEADLLEYGMRRDDGGRL